MSWYSIVEVVTVITMTAQMVDNHIMNKWKSQITIALLQWSPSKISAVIGRQSSQYQLFKVESLIR